MYPSPVKSVQEMNPKEQSQTKDVSVNSYDKGPLKVREKGAPTELVVNSLEGHHGLLGSGGRPE